MPKKIKAIVTKQVHAFAVNGVRYYPGDELMVTQRVYERNAALGILEEVVPPPPPPPIVPEEPTNNETEEPSNDETEKKPKEPPVSTKKEDKTKN